MSTRSFLKLAMDLFDPTQVKDKIAHALVEEAVLIPRTTVHARSVTFSPTMYTMILQGDLSIWNMTSADAQRMFTAATRLMRKFFSLTQEIKPIQAHRPRLTRCVRNTVTTVRAMTTSTTHLQCVACIVAIILAKDEHLICRDVSYSLVSRTSLYRSGGLRQLQQIERADSGELDTQ